MCSASSHSLQKLFKQKKHSSTGNRTLVSRVTGGDTDHSTIEDLLVVLHALFLVFNQRCSDYQPNQQTVPRNVADLNVNRAVCACARGAALGLRGRLLRTRGGAAVCAGAVCLRSAAQR